MPKESVIKKGAEATISVGEYLGRRVVFKRRTRKGYRDRRLDARITKLRTRNEVRSMAAARAAGLHIPWIYDVDLREGLIVMQFIDGQRLNSQLYCLNHEERISIERKLGFEIARMHAAAISHGDLTTSNILVSGSDIYFIDFSMATRPADTEQLGVDLRLLKEVYKSTHSEFEDEYGEVLKGYTDGGGSREAIEKVAEIERRARYV
jgi:Kae1-associated kinase Bud32